MGKKKRQHPDIEEVLARPWCYYCERDFDDLKILISHQKAKHFKCELCNRRLNTAGGLSVHMSQVHKEQLEAVENALEERKGLDHEIFGMEGIPEDVLQAHNQKVIQQFYESQANRQALTGNPPPGSQNGPAAAPKKPKFESPAELKKRLAEHRAKKAAGELTDESTPAGTPTTSTQTISTSSSQSQTDQSPPQTPGVTPVQSNFVPPYSQPPFQPPAAFNAQMPPYGFGPTPGVPYVPPFPPQTPGFPPVPGHVMPGAPPPIFPGMPFPPQFPPPNPSFPPGAIPMHPPPFGHSPLPGFPPVVPPPPDPQSVAGNFGNHPFGPNGRPESYGQGLPSRPFGSSLSTPAPGLPRRPQHVGGSPFSNSPVVPSNGKLSPQDAVAPGVPPIGESVIVSASTAASVDALVSSVMEAGASAVPTPSTPSAPAASSASAKPTSKKDKEKSKDRPTRLVYTDNEVSPEEKLAKWSQFVLSVPRFQTWVS